MTPQEQPDDYKKQYRAMHPSQAQQFHADDQVTTATSSDSSQVKPVKNAPGQPDSQAGDEQTETDLDEQLYEWAKQTYLNICNAGMDWLSGKEDMDKLKQIAESWSRQQTAQILDRLLERQLPGFGGAEGNVPVSAIAALRVGLEGKHGDSK